MSGFVVSEPSLQGQLTRVELQSLKDKFLSLKRDSGHVTTKDLPGLMKKLTGLSEVVSEEQIAAFLSESYPGSYQEIDFESFLLEYRNLQARVGAVGEAKTFSSFLKSSRTMLAEKSSYVEHINTCLCEDSFLKKYLPIDPTGNQLFDIIKDGVLLCKMINVAVPGTIDERAIHKKSSLNIWERNENLTLCLNSAKAIGCTVVNIGAQDLEEGRPHLVLGLLSQIIKIQLSAKTPQHESKIQPFDSSDEKMRNADSQEVCSDEMIEDDDSCLFDSDDMGDADSDIIYWEGLHRSAEMEDDEDDWQLLDDDEDDEFVTDDFDQSLDVAVKKRGEAEEKRSEANHTNGIVDILDDYYERQVEHGFVRRWAFINYSSLPDLSSQKFLIKLQSMCLTLGMEKFAMLPRKEFREAVSLVDIKHLLVVLNIELVLLMPSHHMYEDDEIRAMCENLGIAYQNCYPCQTKGFLKILAREIQYKVVKRLVRLRRLELPLVRDAPTIIFGADMVHVEGLMSIASVVASLDWPKFRKYCGVFSHHPYNEGVVKDPYGGLLTDFFNGFYKRTKERPKRLIFYRYSLEEDIFGYICDQEIDSIKQACASFQDCPPSLTYVVVLPLRGWTESTNKNGKILQGNEIDRSKYKFKFMCRHTTEEVSRIARYFVVHDDNNFPAGELQTLTSRLCTFRHRRENPCISAVVPAYLAYKKLREEYGDQSD